MGSKGTSSVSPDIPSYMQSAIRSAGDQIQNINQRLPLSGFSGRTADTGGANPNSKELFHDVNPFGGGRGYSPGDVVGRGGGGNTGDGLPSPNNPVDFLGANPRGVAGNTNLMNLAMELAPTMFGANPATSGILSTLGRATNLAGSRPTGAGLPGSGGYQPHPFAINPQPPQAAKPQPQGKAQAMGAAKTVNVPRVQPPQPDIQPPMPTDGAVSPDPMGQLTKQDQGNDQPLYQPTGAWDAAQHAFETTLTPQIQDKRSAMGLGRSNAVTKDIAKAWAPIASQLTSDELGREERAIERGTNAMLQQAGLQMNLAGMNDSRSQNALSNLMNFGLIDQNTQQRGFDAMYEDLMRRQGLSQMGLTLPWGQADSTVGKTQQVGGLFK